MNKKEKLIEACEFAISKGIKIVPYLGHLDIEKLRCCPLTAYAIYYEVIKCGKNDKVFCPETFEFCNDVLGAKLLDINRSEFVDGFDRTSPRCFDDNMEEYIYNEDYLLGEKVCSHDDYVLGRKLRNKYVGKYS